MFKNNKTFTAALVCMAIIVLLFISTAPGAFAAGKNTTTSTTGDNATSNVTATPLPSASPTPVPTIGPRAVFSTPRWENDHVIITVNNSGSVISITAWIDNPSKYLKYQVDAGTTQTLITPSIQAQNGQIVSYGFEAYENGTLIDSNKATITVVTGPAPTVLPPESVTISGTIVDADNGSAIANATVVFKSMTYDKTYPAITTGPDGSYISPKMYPDVYSIRVSANGYQSTARSTDKITTDSSVDSIQIKHFNGPTPTPTPTPSPTPMSPVDSWVSLLYNPTLCIGTISSLIAVIAGSIGIYEWLERKRHAREKKEAEEKAKGDQGTAIAPIDGPNGPIKP